MGNIIALLGLLIKLIPFLKEVFLKNQDFREAILSNRAVIGVFFACIVLFVLNLDHIDTLMHNQQKIRELTQGFESVERDNKRVALELTELKVELVALREENHEFEVKLAEAQKIIQVREERLEDHKNTIKVLRRRLGYKTE